MAQLVVMYKTPHDAAAFDRHYFEKHVAIAKKFQACENTRSAKVPLRRLPGHPVIT